MSKKESNLSESTKRIIDILSKGDIQVSFSIYCMSGYFGKDKCNCSRCRDDRGAQVTPETEELSKLQSIIYRLNGSGGMRDTIFHSLRTHLTYLKFDKEISLIADNISKSLRIHFETGSFGVLPDTDQWEMSGVLPSSTEWQAGQKEVEEELRTVADGAKVDATKLNKSFDI